MINFDELNTFDNVKIKDFIVPKLTYVDKRGYIYIMVNKFYPDIFKVGRTGNLPTRFKNYNENQPVPSTRIMLVSNLFTDVHFVEERILYGLRQTAVPLQYKLEWFSIDYLNVCIDYIKEAEKILPYKEPRVSW